MWEIWNALVEKLWSIVSNEHLKDYYSLFLSPIMTQSIEPFVHNQQNDVDNFIKNKLVNEAKCILNKNKGDSKFDSVIPYYIKNCIYNNDKYTLFMLIMVDYWSLKPNHIGLRIKKVIKQRVWAALLYINFLIISVGLFLCGLFLPGNEYTIIGIISFILSSLLFYNVLSGDANDYFNMHIIDNEDMFFKKSQIYREIISGEDTDLGNLNSDNLKYVLQKVKFISPKDINSSE